MYTIIAVEPQSQELDFQVKPPSTPAELISLAWPIALSIAVYVSKEVVQGWTENLKSSLFKSEDKEEARVKFLEEQNKELIGKCPSQFESQPQSQLQSQMPTEVVRILSQMESAEIEAFVALMKERGVNENKQVVSRFGFSNYDE